MLPRHVVLSAAVLACAACAPRIDDSRAGLASWYGGGEPLNTHVAMGRRFDPEALEAAMWDVPFGTAMKVTNLATGRWIVVRVTDRGPARRLRGRVIDLTRASFARLAPLEQGLIPVKVERLRPLRLTVTGWRLPIGREFARTPL